MAQSETHIIAQGTQVSGRVAGDGSLQIEGGVEGSITLNGDVVIADGGAVKADVSANSVTVEGKLAGNIVASASVALGAGSSVEGAIRASSIRIDEGAKFSGSIDMDVALPDGIGN